MLGTVELTCLFNRFSIAIDDIFDNWLGFLESNHTQTMGISLSADTDFCSPVVGLKDGIYLPCALRRPLLNITEARAVGKSFIIRRHRLPRISLGSPYDLEYYLQTPILNILHLTLAAMRVDLGNPSPNNFLAHPSPELINRTLIAVFPQTISNGLASKLHAQLLHELFLAHIGPSAFSYIRVPGPSVVQVVYLCNILKRKDFGNLIVSIFAATFGMFSTLWTVYITFLCWIKDYKKSGHDQNSTTMGSREATDLA